MHPATDRPAGHPGRARIISIVMGAARAAAGLALIIHLGPGGPGDDSSDQAGPDTDPSANNTTNTASVPIDLGPSWSQVDDPSADGWSTEVLSAVALRRWKNLARALETGEGLDANSLSSLVTADFSCGDLVPSDLETAFDDDGIRVERSAAGVDSEHSRRGAAGLATALTALRDRLALGAGARVHFKIFGLEEHENTLTTRQHVAISDDARGGFIEHTATWRTGWTVAAGDAPPRLRTIDVERLEIVTRESRTPLLRDCTASILAANESYGSQLLHGLNHWLERLQDRRFFALLGAPGLAVGDVNGDGLDDLYLCQEGGLPNRLFIQNPDGTATDVSAASGTDWLVSSRSALLLDLDNDGRRDLVVAAHGNLVFARGDGNGHFDVRTLLRTSQDTMSLSAADIDEDGALDLYICSYKRDDLSQDAGVLSIGAASSFVYHDANNAARNVLLRNDIPRTKDARWTFADVTEELGLDVNNRRFSFAAAWEDHDRDGDLDLYVANDFGRNALYRQDRAQDGTRRFVDVAASARAEDSASGMSVAWSDYDRDGVPDVYVSNMFSAAGGRITTQQAFKPDAPGLVRTRLKRFARGNTLLRGTASGVFTDASVDANVTMGRWAWGSSFVDLNGDGWDDIVCANGYITTDDTGDL